MGKKKGGSKASASGAAAAEEERGPWGPLWVERRRLDEDWGRSGSRLRLALEAWRGGLLGLLSHVQAAPAPSSTSDAAEADSGSSSSMGLGVNPPPGQAWALQLEAAAEAAREAQRAALALLERLDGRCCAFREQIRLATSVGLSPPTPTTAGSAAQAAGAATADDEEGSEGLEENEEAAAPAPLPLSAAFAGAAGAAGDKGLIPTLSMVEEGLRGAWAAYGTLEHLAASIDRAALATAGAAATAAAVDGRERLAVLGLLLREAAVASWGEQSQEEAEAARGDG